MDSRLIQSRGCSPSSSMPCVRIHHLAHPLFCPLQRRSRRNLHPSDGIYINPTTSACLNRRPRWTQTGASKGTSSSDSTQPKEKISGYTPANFISYSTSDDDRCHHMIATEVNAPANVCFDLWNDWNRIVDFMDLVSQIGLDPSQPELALFQCFYRWGQLPVLEIVFLLRKTKIEKDRLIEFETIHGMPGSGQVQFIEGSGGKSTTTVIFKLEHQLPNLLVDLDIRTVAVETSCRQIFTQNLSDFRSLAESMVQDPSSVEPRTEAEDGRMIFGVPVTEEDLEDYERSQQQSKEGLSLVKDEESLEEEDEEEDEVYEEEEEDEEEDKDEEEERGKQSTGSRLAKHQLGQRQQVQATPSRQAQQVQATPSRQGRPALLTPETNIKSRGRPRKESSEGVVGSGRSM